jgi:glycosyltransferase involved in cell wall biosynthesis
MAEPALPPDRRSCRLLYVVGQLHTGGLERQLIYLLRALDRDRYKPAVAVWKYSENDVYLPMLRRLGVPLFSVSDEPSGIAKLRAFRRLVRQLEPEVVHSYSFYTNPAASWAVYGTPAIAVGSIRSDFRWGIRDAGWLLGRLSARWPRYQISNSFLAASDARATRGLFTPAQCAVVRNGIDLEQFGPTDVAAGPAPIVGVGYLLPAKRWDRLIRAAQILKRKGLSFTMAVVGDGPLAGELRRQAADLGVGDCVRFVSHTDDVPAVLGSSSFTVLTSANEGCPNAVMEAMACGRAVVATDVGDVPTLVTHGETGFLVPSGDEPALVDALARLITDRELCRRMGQAARVKAEREFSLDRLARETLAAYGDAGWQEREGTAETAEALASD